MQPGFFLCLFHFPFYYYYLLFLTMPSHNFPLPVAQPPTRPARRGCWDVSRWHPRSRRVFSVLPLSSFKQHSFWEIPISTFLQKKISAPPCRVPEPKAAVPTSGSGWGRDRALPSWKGPASGSIPPIGDHQKTPPGCSFRERLPAAPEASNSCQAALRCCSNKTKKPTPQLKAESF